MRLLATAVNGSVWRAAGQPERAGQKNTSPTVQSEPFDFAQDRLRRGPDGASTSCGNAPALDSARADRVLSFDQAARRGQGTSGIAARCALALLACAACAPASSLEAPGLFPIDAPFLVEAPQPPAPPLPPSLTPCPSRWTTRAGAPPACEPWPGDAPESCASDSAQLPGSAHCVRLGSACPSGEWPDEVPDAGVLLYVSSSAPDGGNGSRVAPFANIAQAFAVATTGAGVVLGKGTHLIAVAIPAGVTVRGACVGQTTLARSSSAPKRVELYVTQAAVLVQNLTVTGAGVGAQVEGAGASLTLEDVAVDGAAGYGVAAVRGGALTLRRVVVRNTVALGGARRGAEVALGGSLSGSNVSVEGDLDVGLHAGGAGARITLSDVAVVGPATANTGAPGHGLHVDTGGAVTLSRAVIVRAADEGVSVGAGSTATLTDVVVRDTRVNPATGHFGDGLGCHGGRLTGSRVRLEHNSHSGAVAVAGTVELSDVLVAGTLEDGLGLGLGVLVSGGGSLSVTRGVLRDNVALGAGSDGSPLSLTDTQVLSTAMTALGGAPNAGDGIGGRNGAVVTLVRVGVIGNHGYAIELADAPSRLDASDVSVSGGLPGDDASAVALAIFDGQAALTRVELADAIGAGLYVAGGTTTVADLSVHGTKAGPTSEDGANATVGLGAQLSGTRIGLRDGQLAGLLVDGAGTSVTLSELSATGTRFSCAGAACPTLVSSGVAATRGGAVRLERFLVRDNGDIGLLQASGGQFDAAHGEVSFNAVGVNAGDVGYDLNRLGDDVAYVFNSQKLAALAVPVPRMPALTPSMPQ